MIKFFEQVLFVIPDFSLMISGGNEFNRELIKGLIRLDKIPIHYYTLEAFEKKEHVERALIIIDSLYLNDFRIEKGVNNIYVLLVHHLLSLFPPKNYTSEEYYDLFERDILKRYSGFITSSNFTANYLLDKKLGSHSVVCVEPAVVFDSVDFKEIIRNKEQSTFNILIVGNLIKRKGILKLLEQINGKAKQIKCRIVILGEELIEPEYANRCREQIEEINKNTSLFSVVLTSTKNSEKLKEYYLTSDLLLSVSKMETYGMALLEARFFGKPILALKGGNVENHLKYNNGWIENSIEDVVDRYLSLEPSSTDFQEKLKNAKAFSKEAHRSWDMAAAELLNQINQFAPSYKLED